MKKKILVTGANGQLGLCIQKEVNSSRLNLDFVFMSSTLLDISNENKVREHFKSQQYDYCINCAAYTKVDDAEIERAKASLINEDGPRNLARACNQTNTILLHISTDFVFDGKMAMPYSETSKTNPLGVYGTSKYKGEQQIIRNLDSFFILRTSWLYSEYGQNFMKSMIKYGKARDTLSVVYDQVGTPTYANDLVKAILNIILSNSKVYGVYNYSNEGVASWYDFAKAIFDINQIQVDLRPIRSKDYPLPASRPSYSVLDKEKIKRMFQLSIPYWRDSLVKASKALKELEEETINN